MTTITINNTELPFRAGYRALKDFTESENLSLRNLDRLQELSLGEITRLAVHCINAGYRYDKQETRITEDELVDLLDSDLGGAMSGISLISEAINKQFAQNQKPPAKAKKK